jgi:hypothetical protein
METSAPFLLARYYFLGALAALTLLTPSLRPVLRPAALAGSYYIESGSRLYLRGSSNVTSFTCECHCYDPAQAHAYRVEAGQASGNYAFRQTLLRLPTRSLDCGHRGINSDMYATLKAEAYPHVSIELLSVRLPSLSIHETANLQALVAITIAGVRHEEWINVRVQCMDDDRYRFTGSKPLSMARFGLRPPSPMMGLVKVSDRIDIHLDLAIKAQP